MALQRKTEPMPEGRYWIDLFEPLAVGRPDARASFDRWTSGPAKGKVRVETIEEFPRDGDTKARRFVIFRVLEPVGGFPSKDVGFPEIIKLGKEQPPIEKSPVKTSEDTVHDQSDEEEEPGAGSQTVKVLVVVGVAVGAVIGGSLLWMWLEGRATRGALSAAKSAAA
jgi:hypothetical protein